MSQCAAILAVLSDGKPHPMREIHDRVGTCRLNSRIAELRKRGHNITCDPAGGKYVYQWHAPALDEGPTLAAAGPSSSAETGVNPEPPSAGMAAKRTTGTWSSTPARETRDDGADTPSGPAPVSAAPLAEQLSLEVAA